MDLLGEWLFLTDLFLIDLFLHKQTHREMDRCIDRLRVGGADR